MTYSSYHVPRSHWHPRSSLFDHTIAQTTAAEAIREGNELREKLQGKRILEDMFDGAKHQFKREDAA